MVVKIGYKLKGLCELYEKVLGFNSFKFMWYGIINVY